MAAPNRKNLAARGLNFPMETPIKKIDCHKCRYYYVTWDKLFPHGCRAMKFKSKVFPSVTVFSSSNNPCMSFSPKQKIGKQ